MFYHNRVGLPRVCCTGFPAFTLIFAILLVVFAAWFDATFLPVDYSAWYTFGLSLVVMCDFACFGYVDVFYTALLVVVVQGSACATQAPI